MAEPVSPAVAKPAEVPQPKYSPDEVTYLGYLSERIDRARTQREQKWEELDDMTYTEYWYANERAANTFIPVKLNREESNFQSGIVRDKLMIPLAAVNNLDLSPDLTAYDKNDIEAAGFGEVIEDAMEKTAELEIDDDKKMRRQYELFKQGDVFVEEIHDELFVKDKKLKGSKTFDGSISGVSWTTRLKRMWSRPCRNIISGLNVFLGDMRVYDLWRQPFIFTVRILPRAEAQAKYGKWERWDSVPKDLKQFAASSTDILGATCMRLTPEMEKEHVQEVKYQDPWGNEYAVILSGILMTPVGLPLPWGYNQYNIVQQGLEPIQENFAIHGSMVKRIRTKVAIYDEMGKLVILKAQKSLLPARFNLSGRVVSRRVFMPGAITPGLNPGDLPKIDDGEFNGPNMSEFNTLKLLMDSVDKSSFNPQTAGQNPTGDPTATEILEVQRQAKILLGLSVAACAMLEWKLAWLRLYNLLQYWFKPTGDRVENGQIVDTYNRTNVPRPIPGKGMGRQVTILTKDPLPAPEEIDELEKQVTARTGTPHRFVFADPEQITDSMLTWQIAIIPKEKRTSELSKMMFGKMVSDGRALGLPFDPPYLSQRFAMVWGEDPDKLFSRAGLPVPQQAQTTGGPSAVSPKIQMPKPVAGAMNAAT